MQATSVAPHGAVEGDTLPGKEEGVSENEKTEENGLSDGEESEESEQDVSNSPPKLVIVIVRYCTCVYARCLLLCRRLITS